MAEFEVLIHMAWHFDGLDINWLTRLLTYLLAHLEKSFKSYLGLLFLKTMQQNSAISPLEPRGTFEIIHQSYGCIYNM